MSTMLYATTQAVLKIILRVTTGATCNSSRKVDHLVSLPWILSDLS